MNIDIIKHFVIRCQICDFTMGAITAGRAEEIAKDHIERYEDGNGCPNYSHTLSITEETLVGRNV